LIVPVDSPTPSGRNPYTNPALAHHLDSFEAGAELYHELDARVFPLRGNSWREQGNAGLAWVGEIIPGVALAAGLALIARAVSRFIGVDLLDFEKSPVSAIMLAIAIGLLVRNTVGLPRVYDDGLRFCIRGLLRVGVALLGIRLSLFAAGSIGLLALPIVVACIVSALTVVAAAGAALGLPRRLTSLIAVGTSICGVSAIVATAPVVGADDDETAYSVACITIFGMLALFAYPFFAHWFFDGDTLQMGLFLGTAIHDTAQVAGAGLMAEQQFGDPRAMDTAIVVKLVRNLFMIGVIPLMAILHRSDAGAAQRPQWYRLIPGFVVGFVAMVALRTLGDAGERAFGILDEEAWSRLVVGCTQLASWCLMFAMAGVGLGTRFSSLRRLGWKPLAAGLVAALCVGGVSATLITLLV
jgi:uncharacterized integral membrane protein (TIGR00698 family)